MFIFQPYLVHNATYDLKCKGIDLSSLEVGGSKF